MGEKKGGDFVEKRECRKIGREGLEVKAIE